MARIAFFHNALGKTDGVSLEVDKWRSSLERLGHEVFYCAGNNDKEQVFCIPELSFFHPETRKILENATVGLRDFKEAELEAAILKQKRILKEKIHNFIRAKGIQVLIPNNLMSVGYHLPALIAFSEVIEETGLPVISHNHDFYFEDSGEINPTCELVRSILDTYVPAAHPNVQNLTINRLAQKELLTRKGIRARVVPNVFDFEQPEWKLDHFNADFRESMRIRANDLVFLQATRVMSRKGIELAIDVVAALNTGENRRQLSAKPLYNGKAFSPKNQIILLCSGHVEEFGSTGNYRESLMKRAAEKKVEIRFVGERVKHSRSMTSEGKVYSLWDSYVHADFVTYPSLWEGWGNQFIEAVFAKLPILLFEYPVFLSDLKNDGFNVVSLGSQLGGKDESGLAVIHQSVADRAAAEIISLLLDRGQRNACVEHNYALARERYSCQVLQDIISELLINAGVSSARRPSRSAVPITAYKSQVP